MAAFRQHLRLLSAAWILFQVTSLSTLVPRACCMAHQSAARPDCHEQAAVPHCAKPTGHGLASSMHHDHGQMHEQSPPASSTHDCVLRGTCSGPAAALMALLATYGVLTDPIASPSDSLLTVATPSVADQLIPQFASPDAPPPRA
jgi:hypothetical protein